MPSPFPGMDPYLEAQPFWADLHGTLLSVIKADLKQRLPLGYSVWSDVYIWLHEPDAETRRVKPDTLVSAQTSRPSVAAVATLSAPVYTILPAIRREGNKYLKIKETRSDRVVTVLELLSPANKTGGDDRDAYLAKRNEYLALRTNLVEIDLHRTGLRAPLGEPAPLNADYYAIVCRGIDFPKTSIWPISVRDPLPDVPIPLKPEDGIVILPLQTCFVAAYDQGPYQNEVDYLQPPRIPLTGADALWAKELLAKRQADT